MMRPLLLVAALAGALAAAGCASSSKDDKQVRIISGGFDRHGSFVPGALTGVVAEQGWLKQELAKQGYALTFVQMPHAIGGPMINEGFVNRSLEFAYYGDLPAVIGASAGAPIRLVVPSNMVAHTYLLVQPGSPAKSIADLRGKRIALHRGRPWEAVFARLLEANHLSVSDFQILNVNPSAGAAALAAGKVDGFVGPIADANRLVSSHGGRIIWSTKTAPRDWIQRVELFGRSDFLAAHPDIGKLVATAYVRAGNWAADPAHRDAYIASLSRETPEQAIRADLDDGTAWKDRFSPYTDAGLKTHYAKVIDYSAASKLISGKPDIAPLTDTSLVDEAVKSAGAAGLWTAPGGRGG